jgi:TRAP-type C4-dicarboxylate transport system, small permease component
MHDSVMSSPPQARAESPALRVLSQAVAYLSAGAMALSAIGTLLSLALIGWAVIMRYFFNAAPVWVDEVVGHLLVAIVLLAAAQTFRRGEHIGVDILVEQLPPVGKRWALAWAAIVSGLVALVLIVNGWQTAALARTLGLVTEGHLEWPTWWLMLLMPLGGALLLLAAAETLWRACTGQLLSFASPHAQTLPKDTP